MPLLSFLFTTYTPRTLTIFHFDGKDGERNLLAIASTVFDVTAGRGVYGPDGVYGKLRGATCRVEWQNRRLISLFDKRGPHSRGDASALFLSFITDVSTCYRKKFSPLFLSKAACSPYLGGGLFSQHYISRTTPNPIPSGAKELSCKCAGPENSCRYFGNVRKAPAGVLPFMVLRNRNSSFAIMFQPASVTVLHHRIVEKLTPATYRIKRWAFILVLFLILGRFVWKTGRHNLGGFPRKLLRVRSS
ncbi:hypothetical protein H4582DRAFT_1973315 [Lactarius indigo]|nr:hypothetical protein H4582DRAFT_1973315 [Lactarius indigo]